MLEISLQRATAVRSAVQEVHGHARIPEDYRDHSQPGWIEAARWITRNARLFAKGKLSDTQNFQLYSLWCGHQICLKNRWTFFAEGWGNKFLQCKISRPLEPPHLANDVKA